MSIWLMTLIAYLLVGLGVAIGRKDFDRDAQDEAIGIGIVLAVAIAIAWPWMIWHETRETNSSLDQYE